MNWGTYVEPEYQFLTWSVIALAALIADESPLAPITAAPLFWIEGSKVPVSHSLSSIDTGFPPTIASVTCLCKGKKKKKTHIKQYTVENHNVRACRKEGDIYKIGEKKKKNESKITR